MGLAFENNPKERPLAIKNDRRGGYANRFLPQGSQSGLDKVVGERAVKRQHVDG
jgi:hypothetical protein